MYSTVEDWRHLFSLSLTSSCLSVFLWEWNSGLVKSHSVSTPHEARRRRNVKDKCLSERLCFPPSDSLSSLPPFHSTAVLYSRSLCQPALFLAPFLSHILTLCLFLSLPCPMSFPSILFSVTLSSKAPYGIFSHILDDIWILYIVNTISRVSQSIQAFYQFASLTELHFTLEFNDILLQSADRQIHSCTVFQLCLIH